ncbi:hypothetical protein H4S06_002452, partial [Coemansia sp. BCRC 34490]
MTRSSVAGKAAQRFARHVSSTSGRSEENKKTEHTQPVERKNELDITMLAPRLRKSVFAKHNFEPATDHQMRISIDHLKSQDVYGKESEPVD